MTRLALVGAVALLTACGQADAAPGSATLSQSPTTEIRCGDVVLEQGEQLEVAGAKERACLEGALRQGRSATMAVTRPTVEGDPIVTRWLLTAGRVLSAHVDSRKDRYAGAASTEMPCGAVTELPDPLEC